uniref:IRF tryptophan pentad repeat domain-containing protein n=1 Tax=Canis lupus dingo TaxID=286419 RepID=A0A8C0JRD7_CANLU
MEGPAIWKTRLRCALNKSPEFEEVPENGHRDGAEPYKVYRLLPSGTLPAQPGTQKSPSKRHHSSVSSEREEDERTVKNGAPSPSLLVDPFRNEEVGANGGTSRSNFGSSSNSSPEPQEGTTTGAAGGSLSTDYSLLLTFIYSGRMVGKAQVQSLDCRLVAEPSGSQCGMEQVVFPKPDPPEPTQRLLSQIERGVLVASNSRGLFVQRLCPIPVSWNAPQAPPGPGPHLLPSNECVELFRTTHFCRGEAVPAQLSPWLLVAPPWDLIGSATTLSLNPFSFIRPVPGDTEFLGGEPRPQPYPKEPHHGADGAGLCPTFTGRDSRGAVSCRVPAAEPGRPCFLLSSLFLLSALKETHSPQDHLA